MLIVADGWGADARLVSEKPTLCSPNRVRRFKCQFGALDELNGLIDRSFGRASILGLGLGASLKTDSTARDAGQARSCSRSRSPRNRDRFSVDARVGTKTIVAPGAVNCSTVNGHVVWPSLERPWVGGVPHPPGGQGAPSIVSSPDKRRGSGWKPEVMRMSGLKKA